MERLNEIFAPMKRSFLVAHLRPVAGVDAASSLPAVSRDGACTKGGVAGTFQYKPDPDEVTENDLCDNRQSFLNACQANHFQFDQLRRAKHSTTMLCYSLHNPAAPITDAATVVAAGPGPGAEGGETDERRAARQQSIQLHMRLLLHTSACVSGLCASQNCRKMKASCRPNRILVFKLTYLRVEANYSRSTPLLVQGLLEHSKVCTARANKQMCQVCRRVYALLHIHARDCRDDRCAVLHCKVFRERIKQMRRQQNQLDQRRRAAMNAARRNAMQLES